jgi:MoaA/NifB/PqqE/SkfB family radical SAM enzyme
LWNFGVKGVLAVEKFKRRIRRGKYFPAFLHVSIINSCNLRCQGCWVDVEAERTLISLAEMNRLIADAKAHGSCFFGILGGEPFLHPDLMAIMAGHPDCYFQVFTKGQPVTEKVAEQMRQLGNVTPLISIEGRELVSDARRGHKNVFSRTMQGLENCVKARLLTGVATSVCQSNINELLTENWLAELIRRGVHYVWYYGYRPAGPLMAQELALRPEQLLQMRRFIVEMRATAPIGLVDAYYDHHGQALCPMTTGISHHISPRGDIEPCPVIQFAAENIRDARGIYETIRQSAFLKDFRELTAQATRGCVILERPDLVKALVEKHRARDSTLRGTALVELAAMRPRFSQWLPGEEIPERHWGYWLAKKLWYNDFSAYRHAQHDAAARARQLQNDLAPASPPEPAEAKAQSAPLCPQ